MGDRALLVQLGDAIAPEIHDRVIALDAALAARPPRGLRALIPAYATLLVEFDPLETDFSQLSAAVEAAIQSAARNARAPAEHLVSVCYDPKVASDLATVASLTGLAADEVARQHWSATYRVYMYGFAPGYAYLGGVAPEIQLPRKPAAVRGMPTGSILIAGPQCLVTALEMPTGWWAIGQSRDLIFDGSSDQPFQLQPGDLVRFRPVGLDAFRAAAG